MKYVHTTGRSETVSVETETWLATVEEQSTGVVRGPFKVFNYENHYDGSVTCDLLIPREGLLGKLGFKKLTPFRG